MIAGGVRLGVAEVMRFERLVSEARSAVTQNVAASNSAGNVIDQ